MLRNTCANEIHAKKSHSVDISNKNTDSQVAMAQSVEHATAARNALGSSL